MVSIQPEGESLRGALRWISEQRKNDPAGKLFPIIEEASLRFDLSPLEADYLWRVFTGASTSSSSS